MTYWIALIAGRLADVFPGFWKHALLAALVTAFLALLFRRFPSAGKAIAVRVTKAANRPVLLIAAAMVVPIAIRLACLPWIPPPEPKWNDEFAHLLMADTLAAGRLANPPHPLARHFETIYVVQAPRYSAIYPPGQGLVMAAGQVVVGHPWAGVLLAAALMSGAMAWMLSGCLPPSWAVGGSLLGAVFFGLADEWIGSYYGGAFCAFGGALIFGALYRLSKSPSIGLALLAGIGWSIVWLIRPFESALTGILIWAFVFWTAKTNWKRWSSPAALLLTGQVAGLAITALHDRAVTRSYTLLPYQLSQEVNGVPQSLLSQRPIVAPTFRFPEAKDMYDWQRERKDLLEAHPFRRYLAVLYNTWAFFITPWFSVPFGLALLSRNRAAAVCAVLLAFVTVYGAAYPFFAARYIAAYACVFLYLIVLGLIVLSKTGRRGKWACAFLISGSCITAFAGIGSSYSPAVTRSAVSRQLLAKPGRHVAFVRYVPPHSFHEEWVYNAADIDAARIVWCRAMGPSADVEVARYYADRQFWLVEDDGSTVHLSPYTFSRGHGQ